ncbi:MAG TPA: hypothetical protein VFA18_14640 [Gemmataceae bacterium]|nr:hypothetical protein [Gemmataceae bacterium]
MQRATSMSAVISLLVGIIAAAFVIFLWNNWYLGLVFAIVFWVASWFLIARPSHTRSDGP